MQRRNFLKRILATTLLASPVVTAWSVSDKLPSKVYSDGTVFPGPNGWSTSPYYSGQVGFNRLKIPGVELDPKTRRRGKKRDSARNRIICNPAYT